MAKRVKRDQRWFLGLVAISLTASAVYDFLLKPALASLTRPQNGKVGTR